MNKKGSDPLVGFVVASSGFDQDPFANHSPSKNHTPFDTSFAEFDGQGTSAFSSPKQPWRGGKTHRNFLVGHALFKETGNDSQRTEDTSQSTPTYDDLPEDMRPSVPVSKAVVGYEERIARQTKGEVSGMGKGEGFGKKPRMKDGEIGWSDSISNFSHTDESKCSQQSNTKTDSFWQDSLSKDEEEFFKDISEEDATRRGGKRPTKLTDGTKTRIRVRAKDGGKMDQETALRLVREHIAKEKAKGLGEHIEKEKAAEAIETRTAGAEQSIRSKSTTGLSVRSKSRSKSRSKDRTAGSDTRSESKSSGTSDESVRSKSVSRHTSSESVRSKSRSKSRSSDRSEERSGESVRLKSPTKDRSDESARLKSPTKERSDESVRSKSPTKEKSVRSRSTAKDRLGEAGTRSRSTAKDRPGETRTRSKSTQKDRSGETRTRSKSTQKDRPVETETRSKSTQKDRPGENETRSKSTLKDRSGETSSRSKSALKDRSGETSTRSKSTSKDRSGETSTRSKSTSKDRSGESGTRIKSPLKERIGETGTGSKSRLKERKDDESGIDPSEKSLSFRRSASRSKDLTDAQEPSWSSSGESGTRIKSRLKERKDDESGMDPHEKSLSFRRSASRSKDMTGSQEPSWSSKTEGRRSPSKRKSKDREIEQSLP